jgi:asparagine synthase (glutamine-hydrolysing)
MCGIAGFCDFSARSDETTLRQMTDSLVHRGPDDSGYALSHFDQAAVGLGHRRLSIIDLSPLGHQPMSREHVDIVFNGEIYNFREVRAELERLGSRFASGSDTEVILAGYLQWGICVVDRLIGMFAFALLDRRLRKIYLVRDRLGVKPLYYYRFGPSLLFASELKAFHFHPDFRKEISRRGLLDYLQFGYTLGSATIFFHAHKVSPGSYLEVDIGRRTITETRYWRIEEHFQRKKLRSEEDALAAIEALLISAVNYRMVADVPVGLFLSGGYDSSTVAALLQTTRADKIRTFTIGFEEKELDEAPHARRVADHLGTDHTEYYCSMNDALSVVPHIPHFFDEPFADYSAIPTMLVSRMARRHVTVALSADGGDEVFGGYPKYLQALTYGRWARSVPVSIRRPLSAAYIRATDPLLAASRRWMKYRSTNNKIGELLKNRTEIDFARINVQQFEEASLGRLTGMSPSERHNVFYEKDLFEPFAALDRLLLLDSKAYLPDDLLVKVDRSTMSVSLEGREPLLDHRLVELMGSVPAELKVGGPRRSLKYYLKRIAHKYFPATILDRPKMGFTPPIAQWLRGPLRERVTQYLEPTVIKRQALFDHEEVDNVCQELLALGYSRSAKKVWNLLMFQMWFERWMS